MRTLIATTTLVVAGLLLFSRLGHYALWDDEANTALIGEGVWRTGDTSATIGQNIVAYRNGSELRNLKERYLPPLQYYVAAPFVGPDGPSSFRARLPFALFGLASVVLLVLWLNRTTDDPLTWTIFCFALVTNVSLLLYLRQCRYYALAIFLSVALAYLYYFFQPGPTQLALFVIASIALFASNYLSFVALYACFGLDYLLWGRKRYQIRLRQWLALLLPQILVCGLIACIWNPLGKHVTQATHTEGILEKLKLLWWNIRDGTACEFWVAPLLVAAPIIGFFSESRRYLIRLTCAAAIYLLVITALSPQTISNTSQADVRYLVPLIPLCIAVGAAVVAWLARRRWWIALPLALIAFGTNWLNGGRPPTLKGEGRQWTSTIGQYVGELAHPPSDPYTQTARWINANVHDGESIWVVSDYQTYPLMYHAPRAIYAWQLDPPPAGQFAYLDPIHFKAQKLPDYIIASGPGLQFLMTQVKLGPDVEYDQVAKIDCFWKDLYRPELIWRRFKPLTDYDHNTNGVYIFKRASKPVPPPAAAPFNDFRL